MQLGIMQRFTSKIQLVDNGCWEWTAAKTGKGYGQFCIGGSQFMDAHRFAFSACSSEDIAGKHIHHKCHKRDCVNPRHLEVLTPLDHMSLHPGNQHTGKTHCINGHELSGSNVRVHLNGTWRICRVCARERFVERRRRLHKRIDLTPKSGSGFRGVKRASENRWEASIKQNGIVYYLGCFNTDLDAARAYNNKAIELRGEWAVLNQLP